MPQNVVNTNTTIQVNCPQGQEYCDTNVLILYPELEFRNYMITVQFMLDPSISQLVDGILFSGKTQNDKYTTYLMVYRYVLLAISILFCLAYVVFYCKTPKTQITFEHRFILLLSLSVVIFNDPVFAVTIFSPTIAAATFSVIFVMQFVGFLVVFWIVMWRRMHREPVSSSSKEANWMAWLLGFIVFVMLTIAGSAASVYTRIDPGVHPYTSRPVLYSVFLYITVALCAILLIGLLYHSYQIYKSWNQVIARHRFFFQWSLMMVVIMFALLVAGLYTAYSASGIQIMILFLMCNFYVIMLQILWRFSTEEDKTSLTFRREGSFERAKETLGFNYFDKDTDVEFSRSSSEQKRLGRPAQAETQEDDLEKDGEKERPYIQFDDDRVSTAALKPGVFGQTDNEPSGLDQEVNKTQNLNDTDNFDDVEFGDKKSKRKGAKGAKQSKHV